jgi:hypothetical protein
MLTTDEQEKLVRLLDTNEQIRSNVETLIGRKIDSMKFPFPSDDPPQPTPRPLDAPVRA